MKFIPVLGGQRRGFLAAPPPPPALTAGSITEGDHTSDTINATATAATGGTAPYTYQWHDASDNSAIVGQTTLTLTWTGRSASTQYGYYIVVTDNVSDTAQSSTQQSTTDAAGGIVAGFVGLGSPTEGFTPEPDDTTMLVWNETASGTTVPALSSGFTFIWWCRPEAAQGGFWSGLFHAAYDFDTWGGGAADASDTRYMGMHPYPSNGSTENSWSVSANGADNQTNDLSQQATISQYQRKYVHVGLCTLSGGNMDYRYYYDYVNASSPGRYIEMTGDSKADPAAAARGIIQFDAPWNRGNERFYGPLSMPDIYVGTPLTLAEVDLAIADPFDAAVVGRLWFTNRYPTSNTDITDKSGNGNDPVWVIGANVSTPVLYQES